MAFETNTNASPIEGFMKGGGGSHLLSAGAARINKKLKFPVAALNDTF